MFNLHGNYPRTTKVANSIDFSNMTEKRQPYGQRLLT